MSDERATPVLYLDLDGTVRHGKDELGRFVNGPEDVVVFPEAVELMRRWKAGGGRIIGVSNQGGIALGYVTYERVAEAMMETHRQARELFDKITWCSAAPDSVECPRGPEGVFSLSAGQATESVSYGEDGSGSPAPVVPAVRFRLCARTAGCTSEAAGQAAGVPSGDLPSAGLCGSAHLYGRDYRRGGNDHRTSQTERNPALPGGRLDELRGHDLVARSGRRNRVEATPSSSRQDDGVPPPTVGLASDGSRERSGSPDCGPAIPDYEAGNGDRGARLHRDSARSLTRHHPDANHPENARCWCRKPSPGLLIEAALDLTRHHGEFYPPYMGLMVGDRPEDEECARLAGLDFTPAAEWRALAHSMQKWAGWPPRRGEPQ